ncbi:MAG: hypothetical protein Fur0041_17940 [Bacteroidia bacterium]
MKTSFMNFFRSVSKVILTTSALFLGCAVMAQRPKGVVLNFDTKNVGYDPVQMGNLVRIELEKLDTFSVMDRYDQNFLIEKKRTQHQ